MNIYQIEFLYRDDWDDLGTIKLIRLVVAIDFYEAIEKIKRLYSSGETWGFEDLTIR